MALGAIGRLAGAAQAVEIVRTSWRGVALGKALRAARTAAAGCGMVWKSRADLPRRPRRYERYVSRPGYRPFLSLFAAILGLHQQIKLELLSDAQLVKIS